MIADEGCPRLRRFPRSASGLRHVVVVNNVSGAKFRGVEHALPHRAYLNDGADSPATRAMNSTSIASCSGS
jgi:hypothetical protein